ncbi:MAG: AAA family ATPase [Planctomycetes bacterium]|nr:AAA family ATPase [Planctomycetota bacterium]
MARSDGSSAPRADASFLVLPENKFAWAAISAVGEPSAPDERRQSIYLYGPSGTGKTHLAQWAVDRFTASHPQAHIEPVTAREFAANFAEAASKQTIPLFQAATRSYDLLIVEDVHALERRPQSQIQLQFLCDELSAQGSQVIWTSRVPPGELSPFTRQLISRFRGGVSVRIRPPGLNSRAKLLLHFAESRQIRLTEDAAQLLARQLPVSPRELAATLGQVQSLTHGRRQPIDSELVRKYLEHEILPPQPSLAQVCTAVARQFGITNSQLRSRKQSRDCTLPRQCAMLTARRLTERSLEEIGQYFGGRDHTTVLYACRRLVKLLPSAADLQFHFSQIEASLGVPKGTLGLDAVDDELPDRNLKSRRKPKKS